jgi:hypothetical protein
MAKRGLGSPNMDKAKARQSIKQVEERVMVVDDPVKTKMRNK